MPPIASLMHGFWSGEANKSPLGVQPYAIVFRVEGADVVAETPPAIGEEVLPPGAYQRFTFEGGTGATRLSYRTAMGSQGMLEGTLDLASDRSAAQRRIFCEPNACERFELRWAATGPKTMSFQVWVESKLHADIALAFDGDP